ncbi:MAG: DNA-binding protein [Candidatus Parabeggiatoa sp. nov. 3]|nr:MAG: DNA-binding protein [Gammaproteobacteria bacterium]RKZ59708.1 MAG: DNA-binding protein [Gammaproteobacteria bacterium]
MNIKPIKTEEDYKLALARVSELMDAEMNTPQGDELDILATLIESYEAKHYVIAAPDPIEAIKFRMEQMGLEHQDLEPFIGNLNIVTEVMDRQRELSLAMIRRLHNGLQIPLESLINEYVLGN